MTKKLSIREIVERANVMLDNVEAGEYDKPEDIGIYPRTGRWSHMGFRFLDDALYACGLEHHPQANRVLELLHNTTDAIVPNKRQSAQQKFFRHMLDMASLIHNTRAIGYNSKTGRIC